MFAGYMPLVPARVGRRAATCILMDTATTLPVPIPTAVQADTMSTASATALTRLPTLEPRVLTSTAVTSTVIAIIVLLRVTTTRTIRSVITEDHIPIVVVHVDN